MFCENKNRKLYERGNEHQRKKKGRGRLKKKWLDVIESGMMTADVYINHVEDQVK